MKNTQSLFLIALTGALAFCGVVQAALFLTPEMNAVIDKSNRHGVPRLDNRAIIYHDGENMVEVHSRDGIVILTRGDGTIIQSKEDGSVIQTNKDGTQTIIRKPGGT